MLELLHKAANCRISELCASFTGFFTPIHVTCDCSSDSSVRVSAQTRGYLQLWFLSQA